jgi:hypothetical protein
MTYLIDGVINELIHYDWFMKLYIYSVIFRSNKLCRVKLVKQVEFMSKWVHPFIKRDQADLVGPLAGHV